MIGCDTYVCGYKVYLPVFFIFNVLLLLYIIQFGDKEFYNT